MGGRGVCRGGEEEEEVRCSPQVRQVEEGWGLVGFWAIAESLAGRVRKGWEGVVLGDWEVEAFVKS